MTHPSQRNPSHYHEAGLVVVGKWLDLFAPNRPNGDAEERKFLENYITASWAGRIAEQKAGQGPERCAAAFEDESRSIEETIATAGIVANTDEIEALIDPLRTQAAALVEAHWEEIDDLAQTAAETPELTDGKVLRFTRSGRPPRRD